MLQFEMIMAGLFSFLSKFSGLAGKSVSAKQSSPAEIFERFRNLLRSNNKALEIIADMGEKLGGQYIFDNHYITTSVHELIGAVHNSVDILNTLDPAHYELYPVHQRLKDQLGAILNGKDDRQGPRIMGIDEVGPLQWSIVGGKMAHLAEIRAKLNLDVPPGFIITTGSYYDLIEFNELGDLVAQFEELWEDPAGDPSVFEEVRVELWNAIARAQAPPKFLALLSTTLDEMAAADSAPFSLAVRSSGREEDLDFSFAGQFRTILHVPPEPEPVFNAYREVVQSLFDLESVCYRRRIFPDMGGMSIACGCQRMIDSAVSGVIHTVDPSELGKEILIVVGAPGQGAGVVEGEIPVDTFQIRKGTVPEIVSRYINQKTTAFFPSEKWGLEKRSLSEAQAERSCLDDNQLTELARRAMQLENYFKRPQDIEWTFDRDGKLHLLQSRPLMVLSTNKDREHLPESLQSYEQLSADLGRVAQQGIAAGPVFVVLTADDLQRFPDGAILVSRSDSSRFVKVMHRAAAIITEVGTPVSHMATLCRELRVPCLVDVPNILNLVENGMEITVDAEDRRIFKGRVQELLAYQMSISVNLGMTKEFLLLRRLLNNVSRLHLVDPLMDKFTPENCRTFHDLLRYIHESGVIKLVNLGKDNRLLKRHGLARHLELPIPAGIMVVDIGGGVMSEGRGNVQYSEVTSIPFRAILQGMLYPDVWHRESMPVGMRDLMSSMLNAPNDALSGQYTGHNVAVVSKNYVNLCFRFGYHFNIIDAHCDKVERDNHIYFRFLGGATDMTKRSRRSRLIAEILAAFDFNVRTKGDLVIARAGNMVQGEMERTLDILGRLVGFTRQLDVRLDNERVVDFYVESFLQGNYQAIKE